MKKSLLFFMCVFLLLFSISAQDNKEASTNNGVDKNSIRKEEASKNNDVERKNFFVGIGLKGDVFVNDNSVHDIKAWKQISLGGKMFVGKWFNPYLGSRIVVDFGQIKPTFQHESIIEDEKYILGRLDILLDATNCFLAYSPDRTYNLIPYVGIGGAKAFGAHSRPDHVSASSSFMFGGGLWNTFRVSDKFSVFLEVGMDIVDSSFDGSKYHQLDGIAAVTIGMVKNF